ncbi:MAG: hypothetical protein GY730_08115 [bacterium]|nr:hypothetical protein [bacterium]
MIHNPISSQYETLLEKIKYIESRQEVGELSQKIDIKTISDKVTKLSQDNFRFSKLLDEFQNVHTILKKSDMLDDNMKELN